MVAIEHLIDTARSPPGEPDLGRPSGTARFRVVMAPLPPEARSLHARLAVHTSWAKTEDRSARTAPARKAALDRFEREVDPDGELDPDERARRAAHARKAYFYGLALKSAKARAAKKAA